MPADASIFQQYLQPARSVADYAADMDKAEGNQLQLAAARLQGQQASRAMADDQASRLAYQQSAGDPKAYRNALVQAGNYKAVQALDAQELERGKVVADTGLKTAQTAKATQETSAGVEKQRYDAALHHSQGLAYVNTPEDVQTYIQQGIAKGVFPPMTPEQIQQKLAQFPSVEAFKQQAAAAAIPVLDRFKVEAENARNKLTNDTSRQNNDNTNLTSRQNNASSNATTQRGQNMTDARSRDATAAVVGKPFEVTGSDGQPILVQQDKQGNITPVKGYSPKTVADKQLNDGQSKALLFGTRMQEADKVLGQLATDGVTTSVPGSRTPLIGGVVNAMSGSGKQQLNQAKLDFMTAVLRRESGASISDGEYDNADKQYFPQVGDSPQVIQQKGRNRQLAISGVLAEVPEKQRASITPKASGGAPAAAAPGAGKVINFADLK